MNTQTRENNFRSSARKRIRRRAARHDPMLVLNMSIFNFDNGWNRTLSKYQFERAYA